MKYKHCELSNKYKVICKRNPISEHEWIEHEDLKGFRVHGGRLIDRDFKTLEKAKEAIDFDWELVYGKFANLQKEGD